MKNTKNKQKSIIQNHKGRPLTKEELEEHLKAFSDIEESINNLYKAKK